MFVEAKHPRVIGDGRLDIGGGDNRDGIPVFHLRSLKRSPPHLTLSIINSPPEA
jgi:hypothetical protein